jgi:type VI secretion system protein ImpJ
MKETQRIVWSEGMLMSPHHLQQQDLYHERLLAARFAALSPYAWGVVSMELDPGALGRGEVRLTSFSGVLPDGLPLSFQLGDAKAPAGQAIAEHFPPDRARPLDLFLAVPREREGTPSFVESAEGEGRSRARFLVVNQRVADLSDSTNQVEVAFARENVVLLLGDEPHQDFVFIKIAEIVRDGAGSLVLLPTYVAPCLRVSSSSFLMDSLRRLLGVILGRHRELSDRRRQRDASTLEFDAADVTLFLQLNALNRLIPALKHLSVSGDVAPYQLYMFLSQAAGELTTFSGEIDPVELPPFLFNDLRATFEPLFATLTLLVRETVKETYLKVELMLKNGAHFGVMEGEKYRRCGQFVLAVRTEGLSEQEVAERLPSKSKIASWEDLKDVVEKNLKGAPLKVTHRPPAQVPIKAGVVYFLLDIQSNYWQRIMQEQRVGIYLPPPFDPSRAKVELLGIPGPA